MENIIVIAVVFVQQLRLFVQSPNQTDFFLVPPRCYITNSIIHMHESYSYALVV